MSSKEQIVKICADYGYRNGYGITDEAVEFVIKHEPLFVDDGEHTGGVPVIVVDPCEIMKYLLDYSDATRNSPHPPWIDESKMPEWMRRNPRDVVNGREVIDIYDVSQEACENRIAELQASDLGKIDLLLTL